MLAVSNVSRSRCIEGCRMKVLNLVLVSPKKCTKMPGLVSRPKPRPRSIFSRPRRDACIWHTRAHRTSDVPWMCPFVANEPYVCWDCTRVQQCALNDAAQCVRFVANVPDEKYPISISLSRSLSPSECPGERAKVRCPVHGLPSHSSLDWGWGSAAKTRYVQFTS